MRDGEMHIPFVRKPEGKRSLRRHMHRWEDNITMNLKKTGYK
jgi:hypothetical protein